MKDHPTSLSSIITLIVGTTYLSIGLPPASAQPQVHLEIHPAAPGQVEVEWHGFSSGPSNAIMIHQLQQSENLEEWSAVGERIRSTSADELHLRSLATDRARQFFRVRTDYEQLGQGGAEVFGYSDRFATELSLLGEISLEEFASLYPAPTNYLPLVSVTSDLSTVGFWPEFNVDPVTVEGRYMDYRLDTTEVDRLWQNGFVVSERLAGESFGETFYDIWEEDLPVFISTDAILHAWHRTYDMMLEEVEETFLYENLNQILDGMASSVEEASRQIGDGALREGLMDADYFLAVARTLLKGAPVPSVLGQDSRVQTTYQAIFRFDYDGCFDLFGAPRAVDFSQFKVRGHYENSDRLGRYFQCVMWLGRIDLRVAGGPFRDSTCAPEHFARPRELAITVVLNWLLVHRGQFERWQQFETVIQAFVGWTDSMTFAQMNDLLRAAGITSLDDLASESSLLNLQEALAQGQYGVQDIASHHFVSPLGSDQIRLPQAFTVFGQKFVPDSWALSQSVYDRILWNKGKVPRRVPSCLDVGFAVLANDHLVPNLIARIEDTEPTRHAFRDGYPYQHHLAALRAVMDGQDPSAWNDNIYMGWLAVLRELSIPLAQDTRYPQALRTRAWAMKSVNTQMASWSQLRHDTILYAKQSYTSVGACFFPEGYVEPVPHVWRRLAQLVRRAETLIAALPYSGTVVTTTRGGDYYGSTIIELNLEDVRQTQVEHLQQFAGIVDYLAQLSEMELAQESFSTMDRQFLNTMNEDSGWIGMGCQGFRQYNGWYPSLFYRPAYVTDLFDLDFGAAKEDLIVADVHTDLPDPYFADPGSVLHEGLGRPNMLFLIADCGEEKMMFAGPVLSHFEFELIGQPFRLSDSEWERFFYRWGTPTLPRESRPEWRPATPLHPTQPPVPPWTTSYLVPAE